MRGGEKVIECLTRVLVKGTVSVISRDPTCKESNARFKPVTLKPFSDKQFGSYGRFYLGLKVLNSENSFVFPAKEMLKSFS